MPPTAAAIIMNKLVDEDFDAFGGTMLVGGAGVDDEIENEFASATKITPLNRKVNSDRIRFDNVSNRPGSSNVMNT